MIYQLFNLFFYFISFFFFFFFFFQPCIGLGQAFQSEVQMLFWRKGIGGYIIRTIRSSRWFCCPLYRFLVFFFRRRLRISSFFSYPKQARRRRRGRKSRYRIFITYFYRRFFFRPIRSQHFISYREISSFTILVPFLLTNPTRRFLGRLG